MLQFVVVDGASLARQQSAAIKRRLYRLIPGLANTFAVLCRVGVVGAVAAGDACAVAAFVYPHAVVLVASFTLAAGANGRTAWSLVLRISKQN